MKNELIMSILKEGRRERFNMNQLIQKQESVYSDYQSINILDECKLLFYKCQFSLLLEKINDYNEEKDRCLLGLLKSKALYELNRIKESREKLDQQFDVCENDINYKYVKASLLYFDGEFEKSINTFKEILDSSNSVEVQFKALLGIGNNFHSMKLKDEALVYLRELSKLKDQVSKDLLFSFHLFEGNVYQQCKINPIYAKECFEFVYKESFALGWNYFAQKALYSLSKWYKQEASIQETKVILNILDLQLMKTDSRFLSFLVNNEFQSINFKSNFEFYLCAEKYQVSIGESDKQVVCLKRWPLLFKFLKTISDARDFVSKNTIANYLWPDQTYKPKTHDPRIYDIVARLKKHLETFDQRPLFIESSPKGYKLNIR